jgi:hypothetical protein
MNLLPVTINALSECSELTHGSDSLLLSLRRSTFSSWSEGCASHLPTDGLPTCLRLDGCVGSAWPYDSMAPNASLDQRHHAKPCCAQLIERWHILFLPPIRRDTRYKLSCCLHQCLHQCRFPSHCNRLDTCGKSKRTRQRAYFVFNEFYLSFDVPFDVQEGWRSSRRNELSCCELFAIHHAVVGLKRSGEGSRTCCAILHVPPVSSRSPL